MTSAIKINKCYQKKLKKYLVLYIGVFLCMYNPGISSGAKCGRPGRTVISSYKSSVDAFNEGDVIRYSCTEKNHTIIGSPERRCQTNGIWSDDIPVCSKIAHIENVELLDQDSEVENINSVDGNISTCSEAPQSSQTTWRGYLSASINIFAVQITFVVTKDVNINVVIQDDGFSAERRCRIKAGSPEVTVKSTVTLTFYCPERTVGKYVHVTCSNQALKICEVSVLLPPDSRCLTPDIPLHGTGFKKSNGTDSEYQFRCNDGYKIWGDLLVTCQPDGRWSPKSPTCGEIFCFPPSELENGKVYHIRKSKIPYNSTATYTCNDGFYLDGPSVITCRRWNEWDFPPPVCIPSVNNFRTTDAISLKETRRQSNVTHCGNLPNIANGALIVNSSNVGSIAWLKCSEGFKPLTFDHVSCLPTGEWSSQSLHCAIIQCEPNPIIPYGKAILLNNSSYYGTLLEIKCNEGYTSHNRITRKCNELGTWGDLNVCVEITCGTFTATEDTNNNWVPVNGSTYIRVLICPENFHIEGSPAVVRCLSNGSWSYTSAKCAKSFANFWGSSWSPSFMLVTAVGAGAGTAILILCLAVAFLVMKKRRQSQTNTTVFHLENVSNKDRIEQSNKYRKSHLSQIENCKNEIEFWSQSSCTNPRKSHSPLPNLPVDADPVYAQPFETATPLKKTSVATANKKEDFYNNHIYAEPVDSRKQTPTLIPISPTKPQMGNDRRLSAIKTNFIYESPPLIETDQQNCDKKCAIYDSSSNSTLNSGQLINDEKRFNENTELGSLTYNLEYLELL